MVPVVGAALSASASSVVAKVDEAPRRVKATGLDVLPRTQSRNKAETDSTPLVNPTGFFMGPQADSDERGI